ncbi:MAG: sulfatase, partial [Thermogutta sp.]|nr:sulfatase [Thermogutta sp.]
MLQGNDPSARVGHTGATVRISPAPYRAIRLRVPGYRIAYAACLALSFWALCSTTLLLAQDAEKPDRPNILLCLADDASFPHMGAYGCSWVRTPGFDRVARDGLLFLNAYTPNPKCAPSRATILTGRNSWQLEEACNHVPYFPNKFKVYTEVLAERGYFVGKTGKGWAPGVARNEDGLPRALAGKGFDARKIAPPTSGISNNDYAGNFADFLAAVPPSRPWCFWYGSVEPHRGYEYGSGIAKGGKSVGQVTRVPGYWPDNETVRTDILDYAFEIEHFDRHLVRMLTMLEEKGLLENTLVVVTADNGAPFPRAKGQCYEASAHLPLAVMWKRGIASPGRTIEDYVSFADFAPTFLELAGIPWDESGMHPPAG